MPTLSPPPSSSPTLITVSSSTSQLHIWRPPSTTPFQTHSNCPLSHPNALAISSLGIHCLIENASKTTVSLITYPRTGPPIRSSLPEPRASCIAATAGYLAIGMESGRVYIWTLCGRLLASVFTHWRGVVRLLFSDDAECLVTGGYDGAVAVWKMGEMVGVGMGEVEKGIGLEGHMLPVCSIGIGVCGAGGRIVSGGRDGWVKVWHVGSGRGVGSVRVGGGGVREVAFGGGESVLYVGGADGDVRVVDTVEMVEGGVVGGGKRLKGGGGGVSALAVGGGLVVVGYDDGGVRVFEEGSRVLACCYAGHGGEGVDGVLIVEGDWGQQSWEGQLGRVVEDGGEGFKVMVSLGGGLEDIVGEVGDMAVKMAFREEGEAGVDEEILIELESLRKRNRELEEAGKELIKLVEMDNAIVRKANG